MSAGPAGSAGTGGECQARRPFEPGDRPEPPMSSGVARASETSVGCGRVDLASIVQKEWRIVVLDLPRTLESSDQVLPAPVVPDDQRRTSRSAASA